MPSSCCFSKPESKIEGPLKNEIRAQVYTARQPHVAAKRLRGQNGGTDASLLLISRILKYDNHGTRKTIVGEETIEGQEADTLSQSAAQVGGTIRIPANDQRMRKSFDTKVTTPGAWQEEARVRATERGEPSNWRR